MAESPSDVDPPGFHSGPSAFTPCVLRTMSSCCQRSGRDPVRRPAPRARAAEEPTLRWPGGVEPSRVPCFHGPLARGERGERGVLEEVERGALDSRHA